MIVDSSAIVAIVKDEPDAPRFAAMLESIDELRISAATWLESAIVIDGDRDAQASRRFDELVREAELIIEPVTESQIRIARQAYREFGKGSGSPARLNFGDCLAYALAIDKGEPLLFKGDDFSHTGVRPALEP